MDFKNFLSVSSSEPLPLTCEGNGETNDLHNFCYAVQGTCTTLDDCVSLGMGKNSAKCNNKKCVCGDDVDCGIMAPGTHCQSGKCVCPQGYSFPSGTIYPTTGCSTPIPCDPIWSPHGPCPGSEGEGENFTGCLAGFCTSSACTGTFEAPCNTCIQPTSQSVVPEDSSSPSLSYRAGASPWPNPGEKATLTFETTNTCPETACPPNFVCYNSSCIPKFPCKDNTDCACSLYCTPNNFCAPIPSCSPCNDLYSRNICGKDCPDCKFGQTCTFTNGKWQWSDDFCSPNTPCGPVEGKPAPFYYCKNGVVECNDPIVNCGTNHCGKILTCPSGEYCDTIGSASQCRSLGASSCGSSLCGTVDGSTCSQYKWEGVEPGACPNGFHCTQKEGSKPPYYCKSDYAKQFTTKDLLDELLTPYDQCPQYLNLGTSEDGSTNTCYENKLMYDLNFVDTTRNPLKKGGSLVQNIAASNPIAFYTPAIDLGDAEAGVVPANYANLANQTNLQVLMSNETEITKLNNLTPTLCAASGSIQSPCGPLGGGMACAPGTAPIMLPSPGSWFYVPAAVKKSLQAKFENQNIPKVFGFFACKHSEFCPKGYQKDINAVYPPGSTSLTKPTYVYGCRRIPLPLFGEMCRYSSDNMDCSHVDCSSEYPANEWSTECHTDSRWSHGWTGATMCGRFTAWDELAQGGQNVPGGFFYVPNGNGPYNYTQCTASSCPASTVQQEFHTDDDTTRHGVRVMDWTIGGF